MIWDRSRVLGVTTDYQYVPHATYLDGQLSYAANFLGGKQTVFVNVQNIFDKDPTYYPQTGGATPLPTNPNLYDQVGAMLRLGVRLDF
jgi:outer membrane receptor protein involved in Fe transport